MTSTAKKCRACGEIKDEKEFYAYAQGKSGKTYINNDCKECYKVKGRLKYNPPKPSYVYIITNPSWPDYVKIGKTNNIHTRLGAYQTSSPFRDYKCEAFMWVNDPHVYEKLFKDKYRYLDKIHDDEWFKIPVHVAVAEIMKLYETRSNKKKADSCV